MNGLQGFITQSNVPDARDMILNRRLQQGKNSKNKKRRKPKMKTRQQIQFEEEFYRLPECEFKFVYVQAVDPDYAENLINDLERK